MDIHALNNSKNTRYAALPEYSDLADSQVAGSEPHQHQATPMADNDNPQAVSDDDRAETKVDSNRSKTRGLGLGNIVGRPSQIKRVPVGITRSATTEGLLSPASLSPANFARVPSQENVSIGGSKSGEYYNIPGQQASSVYLGPSTPGSFHSDMGLLGSPRKVDAACPTQRDILISPWSWISAPLLFLAIYSTAFSGIFLGIALAKPRWGDKVGTNGHLSFANASLLSAIFSKTVEISFVTVFVALLGQILTRRAFWKSNGTGGISIAEMNMRTWIMQPGSLLVGWQSVRYANSFIGAAVLISAFSATWYTTASEALVSPKLKFGPIQERSLSGLVRASYANAMYLGYNCEVPFTQVAVDDYKNSTCLQIKHAGMGFSFLSSFLRDWTESVAAGNTTDSTNGFDGRPLPVAVLYDNTTINGQWITPSQENITTDSSTHGRLVENVTMAMPHAGIFKAVRDGVNHILQPSDLQGAGEYIVQASLPAPIVNILCVGLSAAELSPMIVNVTNVTTYVPNATVVDSIFGWDPKAEKSNTPFFPKIPIEYNTIVHVPSLWGPPAISLLATPPKDTTTNEHVLCTIKSALYRNCTTYYKVAQSGGLLTVHCDADELNTLPYYRTRPEAPIGDWSSDWKDIGGEWIKSLALNNGVSDANASSARLLTQYIPEYDRDKPTTLPTHKPTIGEAIGVLAGGTLLLASQDGPFEHGWNFTDTTLDPPQYQSFPARYTYKDYASGGTQGWQAIFYVVLFTTFLLSATALGYLCWKFTTEGYVTDYTEPQNTFALAVNSPPSSALYGACGGGPKGEVMARKWTVDMTRTDSEQDGFQYQPLSSNGRHPHFSIRCADEELSPMIRYSPGTPQTSKRVKFRRSRPPTMNESWGLGSPVVEQYQRLAGRS